MEESSKPSKCPHCAGRILSTLTSTGSKKISGQVFQLAKCTLHLTRGKRWRKMSGRTRPTDTKAGRAAQREKEILVGRGVSIFGSYASESGGERGTRTRSRPSVGQATKKETTSSSPKSTPGPPRIRRYAQVQVSLQPKRPFFSLCCVTAAKVPGWRRAASSRKCPVAVSSRRPPPFFWPASELFSCESWCRFAESPVWFCGCADGWLMSVQLWP